VISFLQEWFSDSETVSVQTSGSTGKPKIFEVLESTRNLPFKLPSDAIYILRVSAIIEGLGTTYIENFNGIKDILPILQKNIPKALGANESVIETIIEEIKDIPFIFKDLKSVIKQANAGELKIEVSNNQLEWISKEIKAFIKPIILSFALIFTSIFTLLYDKDLKEIALILFTIGIIKLVYK
jgi:predicted unusual protein kinase regulating ubiquinone biosynthesis (AarF/ABC1/UbiB family)